MSIYECWDITPKTQIEYKNQIKINNLKNLDLPRTIRSVV